MVAGFLFNYGLAFWGASANSWGEGHAEIRAFDYNLQAPGNEPPGAPLLTTAGVSHFARE